MKNTMKYFVNTTIDTENKKTQFFFVKATLSGISQRNLEIN